MNRRARELELENTHFENPIGLDAPGNYSSAHDLARLAVRPAQAQLHPQGRRPHVGDAHHRRTGRARSATATRCSRRTRHVNGLKTGHTTHGRLRARRHAHARDGVTLVSVVLGTPSLAARDHDSLALLQWGAGQLPADPPGHRRARSSTTPEIEFRRGATLPLVTGGSVSARRARRREDHVSTTSACPTAVTGPVARGQQFGYREVFADGKRIAAVPIVAQSFVPARRPAAAHQGLVHAARSSLLLAVVVLGGTVLVARRMRRGPPRRRPPRSEPEAA